MTRLALVPRRERSPGSSRYELLVKIASGATATVFVARLTGAASATFGREGTGGLAFSRLVAVKRAHPHLVDDLAARHKLLEEARLASRIHHANVAAVHDVDETEDDLLLVMDYVEGGSLAELLEASVDQGAPIPPAVAVKIALDACAGLSAVHELCDDDGRPIGLVHRDVSPQNVLVGVDGTARITDFGLARLAPSANLSRTTGAVQGKIAYVSPEYVEGAAFDVRSEVFALGVVVWEALANRRLFRGANEADTLRRVLSSPAPPLSQVAPQVGPHLDKVIAMALEKQPSKRYPTVRAFGEAIERVARKHELIGTSSEVGAWVRACVGANLDQRKELLRASVAPPGGAGDASFSDTVSMLHTDILPRPTPVSPVPDVVAEPDEDEALDEVEPEELPPLPPPRPPPPREPILEDEPTPPEPDASDTELTVSLREHSSPSLESFRFAPPVEMIPREPREPLRARVAALLRPVSSRLPLVITGAALLACILMLWIKASPSPTPTELSIATSDRDARPPGETSGSAAPPIPPPATATPTVVLATPASQRPPELPPPQIEPRPAPAEVPVNALPSLPDPPHPTPKKARQVSAPPPPPPAPAPETEEPASPKPPPNPYRRKH